MIRGLIIFFLGLLFFVAAGCEKPVNKAGKQGLKINTAPAIDYSKIAELPNVYKFSRTPRFDSENISNKLSAMLGMKVEVNRDGDRIIFKTENPLTATQLNTLTMKLKGYGYYSVNDKWQ